MGAGFSTPLGGWQRTNVLAAAQYLRPLAASAPDDMKLQALYRGLLEVLEPAQRVIRQQAESRAATRAAVSVREKRTGPDRRTTDRRRVSPGPHASAERRQAARRSGRDQRRRT